MVIRAIQADFAVELVGLPSGLLSRLARKRIGLQENLVSWAALLRTFMHQAGQLGAHCCLTDERV